jgi:hypothetical protein
MTGTQLHSTVPDSHWSSVENLLLDERASVPVLGFCAGREKEFRYTPLLPPPPEIPDNRDGDKDSITPGALALSPLPPPHNTDPLLDAAQATV